VYYSQIANNNVKNVLKPIPLGVTDNFKIRDPHIQVYLHNLICSIDLLYQHRRREANMPESSNPLLNVYVQ